MSAIVTGNIRAYKAFSGTVSGSNGAANAGHFALCSGERRKSQTGSSSLRAWPSPSAGVLPSLPFATGRFTPSTGLPDTALRSQR